MAGLSAQGRTMTVLCARRTMEDPCHAAVPVIDISINAEAESSTSELVASDSGEQLAQHSAV